MPSTPRLAVVIPSHNSKELTLECLGSLPSGGVRDLEVWVVDDASEDGSREAITAAFPDVGVVRSDQLRGFTVSANRGLRHTRADVLLLLNSDTEVRPGSLAALVDAFDEDPEVGIVGGNLHYPDGNRQWSGGREPSVLWLFALASGLPSLLARLPGYPKVRPPVADSGMSPVDWVTGAAMAVRREVWRRIGPLDERFRFYCQDLDFCCRAALQGWKVAVLAEFRVLHHHGATIGRRKGVHGRQHPELLWTDLVCWALKHRGPNWARRALRTLKAGSRLRLFGRALAAPFVPRSERAPWNRDTRALRSALRALGRISPKTLS